MLSEIEKTKITFSRALTFRELCWIIILRNCFILWLSLKHITHFTRTSDSVAHYTIKNSLLKNFYAICVCEFVWPPVSFGRDYSCYLINIFSWENLHFEAGWFCIYTYTCVCVCVCVCVCTLIYSVLFSTVTQSCLNLCDPMDGSTPGSLIHHQLPEIAQTHVLLVSIAIQTSCPLLSPSPPAFNFSQHQVVYQRVSCSN